MVPDLSKMQEIKPFHCSNVIIQGIFGAESDTVYTPSLEICSCYEVVKPTPVAKSPGILKVEISDMF